MKSKVIIISLATVLIGSPFVFSQNKKEKKALAQTVSEQPKDNLNKVDSKNQKQGLWFFMHEARMGEPRHYEYGNYKDDKKTGIWTKLDNEQQLAATENYQNGVLNGTAQYYEEGHLSCIGNYRGLNQNQTYDSIWVTDPTTLIDSMVVLPTEIGHTKHGIWRYYNINTGHLMREEEYQVDYLIYEKDFRYISTEDSIKAQANTQKFLNKKKHTKLPPGKRSLIK